MERKKFVPNLNVQRLVKKESDEPAKSTEGKGGKRRKENKHERREKNSRDRPTLIQTGSIFSEGTIRFLILKVLLIDFLLNEHEQE